MVVRSGFEVQLVSADTKIPFKEHEKDGKIYVEAEPDAEYFIAIRRVDMSGSPVIKSYYYIDGNFLGYYSFHKSVQKEPSYQGVFSRTNGVAKTSSLKFSKPKAASDGDGYRGGMGKTEIKLYEAISSGMTTARDFAPDFEYALAGAANAGDGKKKFLLSTKGSTVLKTETVTQPGSIVRYESFVTGKCIGSILLNYCSALGMIEVGVLPKPADIWEHERMKRPVRVKKEKQPAVSVKIKKDPVDPSKLIELIDLSDQM